MIIQLVGVYLSDTLDNGVIQDIGATLRLLDGLVVLLSVDQHLVNERAKYWGVCLGYGSCFPVMASPHQIPQCYATTCPLVLTACKNVMRWGTTRSERILDCP